MSSTDRTLRDLLRTDGRLSFDRAAQLLAAVADALAPMHATGQAHGAITPQSVHLDPDGGAWLGPPAADVTATGLMPPAYLAPERMAGEPADPRSDVYTLGLLGWEMLTGQTPWGGDSLEDVVLHQRERDLPRLTTVRPSVPRPLLLAIEGALHKQPSDRWSDAGEMLAKLRGAVAFEPESVEPTLVEAVPVGAEPVGTPIQPDDAPVSTSPLRPADLHRRSRRLAALALAVAVLVSGAAALTSIAGRRTARANEPWMDSVVTSTSAGVLITSDTTHGSAAPVHGNRSLRRSDLALAPADDSVSSDSTAARAAAGTAARAAADSQAFDEVSLRERQRGDSIVADARERAGWPRLDPHRRPAPNDSARPTPADSANPTPSKPDSASRPDSVSKPG